MKDNLALIELFFKNKQQTLKHRYVTNAHIKPLLDRLSDDFKIDQIGRSVEDRPIYGVKFGSGNIRVMMWSQMHGNESTTTKALFDLFNAFSSGDLSQLQKHLELYIIPILNPDGAAAYTRHNVNDIDLNRDAIDQSQPESRALMHVFNHFQPHYCFNLHGQRTIFSAGPTKKPATLSFLAPAQDEAATITTTRKKAMEVIVAVNNVLHEYIPGQIGIYDDSFNLNCVGDTFQSHDVPTILFEAGHYKNDYQREAVRKFMFMALLSALFKIKDPAFDSASFEAYSEIPENQKLFCDILFKNARLKKGGDLTDIAFQFEEKLIKGQVQFLPKIEKIGKDLNLYGHWEIPCDGKVIRDSNKKELSIDFQNETVYLNNELFSLNPDKT